VQKTTFVPASHAFRFANRFVNEVFSVRVPPFFRKRTITTDGRCGGMAFAALDYFHANAPIPELSAGDFPGAGVPPDGHWLADYIYSRQMDTFKSRDAIRFVHWTVRGDTRAMSRTLHNEIPKARTAIDKGTPVVLGLVGASGLTSVGKGNHQVVCYGYEERSPGITTLFIYDPNHPPIGGFSGEVTLRRRLGSSLGFEASRGGPWRGFFVQRYSPRRPPRTGQSGGGSAGGGGVDRDPDRPPIHQL
jgi:hypothetical protein